MEMVFADEVECGKRARNNHGGVAERAPYGTICYTPGGGRGMLRQRAGEAWTGPNRQNDGRESGVARMRLTVVPTFLERNWEFRYKNEGSSGQRIFINIKKNVILFARNTRTTRTALILPLLTPYIHITGIINNHHHHHHHHHQR